MVKAEPLWLFVLFGNEDKEKKLCSYIHFLDGGRPVFSLEIFPPKKNSGVDTIYTTLDSLKTLSPDLYQRDIRRGRQHGGHSNGTDASHIKNNDGIEAGWRT